MSGNATEEGLLTNLSNPTHKDPARPAVLLSAVVAALSLFALRSLLPSAPMMVLFLVAGVVFVALTMGLLIWLSRRAVRENADFLAVQRQTETQETQRKVAQMKRENDA